MPCDYRINKIKRIVFSRGYDIVSEGDLMDHRLRLTRDADFDATFDQLFDLSQTAQMSVTSDFLRGLATRPLFAADSKRAFVAVDDLVFGNARAYQAWSEASGATIRVFRDIASASRWLETDEAEYFNAFIEAFPKG